MNEFYKNPNEQIIWSDFVISRAGAISLSEITSLKRGVVMIPLPTSIDNHQLWNAKSIEGISMGILHEQKEHINHLKKKVDTLIKDKVFMNKLVVESFLDKSIFYSLNYGLFESIPLPHNTNIFIKRTFCMEFLIWTRWYVSQR